MVSLVRARAALIQKKQSAGQYLTAADEASTAHFTDRRYMGRTNRYNRPPLRQEYRRKNRDDASRHRKNGGSDGKCWICGKEDCRSWKHPDKEQREARGRYNDYRHADGKSSSDRAYQAFLQEFEGCSISESEDDGEMTEEEIKDEAEAFYMVNTLQDRAFIHQISTPRICHSSDIKSLVQGNDVDQHPVPAHQFTLTACENETFFGILPDTGAAMVLTAGVGQLVAYKRLHPEALVDKTRAGEHQVRFGQGDPITLIAVITVATQFGDVEFHVMETSTPFLLCLRDMDRCSVRFDNLINYIIKGDVYVPIIRKCGHPWFFTDIKEAPEMFMTDVEMRRLHRRFSHPTVDRLHKLLDQAGHNVDHEALAEIERFYHHCQMHKQAPRCFKFTLLDDQEFNYEIVVDVMYLDGDPVLHLVDSATFFQAARFLKSLSAKDTWEALRAAWIDTYLGPPNLISHDAGTNFASIEFKAEARMMGIICQQVPVESHNAIGKVERYHAPLRRAYDIIFQELGASVKKEIILQMAVKAVNDTVGPDGIVPTVLVFRAYPRMTYDSPPSQLTARCAQAMRKAMADLKRAVAKRQINDALKTKNGPSVTATLNLAPGSEVRV